MVHPITWGMKMQEFSMAVQRLFSVKTQKGNANDEATAVLLTLISRGLLVLGLVVGLIVVLLGPSGLLDGLLN